MDAVDKKFQSEMLNQLLVEVQNKVSKNMPIHVVCKDDAIDEFDLYSQEQIAKGAKITKKDLEYLKDKRVSHIIAEVDFDRETSYQAFYYFVWNSMSLVEKLTSVIWFNQLTASNNNKKPMMVAIDDKIESMIQPLYHEKEEDVFLHINPRKLAEHNIQPYMLMEDILLYNFEDDLNMALWEYEHHHCITKFDELTILNAKYNIEEPEAFEKFLNYEPLTEEEGREVCIFGMQPKFQAMRKNFELLCDYMNTSEEVIAEDPLWKKYLKSTLEDYQRIDTLYAKYYGNDKEKIYEETFAPYIKQEMDEELTQ